MNPTNLTINDLFSDDAKLTFLVGAGCSVDAPSCLPAGREMMDAIINYACAESEIENLLGLEQLRFEGLVEIIRDRLDPELKIIDYYGESDKPNLQHFFLAEMVKQGHFVMTTNFDFLIERALIQSNVNKKDVVPVITKEDYQKYNNPHKLFEKGKKTVYKIHGSTKNAITGEDTRDSLVATIRAFGSNKEGLNVFQVEPFKRPLFDNISNGRTLVVMGYSGSDDFDVVPTLMVLKDLKNIMWINYIKDDKGKERIYEIDDSIARETKEVDKVNRILVDICKMRNADHIYRVDANTTRLIEGLLDAKPKVSADWFSVSPNEWLKENVKSPSQIMKYAIPNKIYYDFVMYDDSMRCSEEILRIAEKTGDKAWKSTALSYIGIIYKAQGNYPEALKQYEEALTIGEQLGDLSGKATRLNNIATIYGAQGNYPEALKRYEEALKIGEQLGDLSGKATRLNNIGMICHKQGNYPEALKRYEEALKIDEQLGSLSGKATYLNNIGMIYKSQGNYPKALKWYEEALTIGEQLGDISGKATRLNNIATIYGAQGNYPEALKRYEEALKIDEQLGDLSGKATRLNNIATIYHKQGNYPEALKRYEEALKIDEQLENLSGKAIDLNNIGMIYHKQGNYPEALKRYEEALKIDEQLENLSGKAIDLNNIASIHYAQTNYPKALKQYEEALTIGEQLGDLSGKATRLNNIGMIYKAQGNYPKALKCFKKALQILNELGLSDSPNARDIRKNIEFLKSKTK